MFYECKKDWVYKGEVYFKKGEKYSGNVSKDRLGVLLTVEKEGEFFPVSFREDSVYFKVK